MDILLMGDKKNYYGSNKSSNSISNISNPMTNKILNENDIQGSRISTRTQQ
jgi:hypothetical protein